MKINALYVDLNSAMLRPETIRAMLRAAASAGRNAILWSASKGSTVLRKPKIPVGHRERMRATTTAGRAAPAR